MAVGLVDLVSLFLVLLPIVPAMDGPDRRRRPRLRLAYALSLRRPGDRSRLETTTLDVSCEGFFCVTDRLFYLGETLDCELVIPAEPDGHAAEQEMVLRCQAEVVRVVPREDSSAFGVACRLADYIIDGHMLPLNVTSHRSGR